MQWFSESAKFFMTLTKNKPLPVYVAKERCLSAVSFQKWESWLPVTVKTLSWLCLKILRWIITQNVEDHNVRQYGTAKALSYCTTLNYFCSEAGTSFKTYVLLMDKCIINCYDRYGVKKEYFSNSYQDDITKEVLLDTFSYISATAFDEKQCMLLQASLVKKHNYWYWGIYYLALI